jgi:hypothetical protein
MHRMARAINGLPEIASHFYVMQISSEGNSSSRPGRAVGFSGEFDLQYRASRKINREWLSLGGFEAIM